MTIEEIWRELEMEADSGGTAGWLTRFALPQPAHPLLVALEVGVKARAILLPLPKSVIPPRRDWPNCRGLEMFSISLAGQAHLGVRLRDATCADVFAALAEDVAPRVAAATNARAAAKALLERLRRWQKFLAAGASGLTVEQQRGLYGELHILRAHLWPHMGATAVAGWRAPRGTHQDFQFASGSLEVKTTSAKQPQTVRITSERQLDDTGIPALFLHVVVVDEREVEGESAGAGESLPGIVTSLRELLQADPRAVEAFDDRLLETGYLDGDGPRYADRRFTVRKERTFHVGTDFPRIVERDLPTGVGDVGYSLSLAACEPFSLQVAGAVAMLASGGEHSKRRRNR